MPCPPYTVSSQVEMGTSEMPAGSSDRWEMCCSTLCPHSALEERLELLQKEEAGRGCPGHLGCGRWWPAQVLLSGCQHFDSNGQSGPVCPQD